MKKTLLTFVTILSILPFLASAQWTNGSGDINNTNSGNVGIGTTNPVALLSIGSSSTRGTLTVTGSSAAAPVISLGDSRTNGHGFSLYSGLSSPGDFNIFDQSASAYRFTINALGNVGIGSFTPIFKFQVESGLAGVARFTTSATGNTGNISIINGASYNYGVMGVVSGTEISTGDVYGLGYSSNANSSFNNVLNWTSDGNVGIGTAGPDAKLAVKGIIHAQEIKVDMNALPDYVFTPTYNLATLKEVKSYIDQNHHLPEVPSAQKVAKEGLNLGEMNAMLLKKIEELTLYLIEKDKQVSDQNAKLSDQQKEIEQLKQQQVRTVDQDIRITTLERALLKLTETSKQ